MSRRDECLIDSYEDAIAWLEEFEHTVTDEAALKVMRLLADTHSEEWDDLQNQISCKDDQINNLEQDVKEKKQKIIELEEQIERIRDDVENFVRRINE